MSETTVIVPEESPAVQPDTIKAASDADIARIEASAEAEIAVEAARAEADVARIEAHGERDRDEIFARLEAIEAREDAGAGGAGIAALETRLSEAIETIDARFAALDIKLEALAEKILREEPERASLPVPVTEPAPLPREEPRRDIKWL